MDHLLEHEGEAVPASGGGSGSGPASGSTAGAAMEVDEDEDADAAALGIGVTEGVEAKVRLRLVCRRSWAHPTYLARQSIKCSICSKTFRNTALANFHAEKSGHDQFEESTEEVRRACDET